MTTLEKIQKEAKKIRAKNKNIAWTAAIKKASENLRKNGQIGKEKVKDKTRQTGSSVKHYDEMKNALPPGKRKSATDKIYYERRKNRSDKPGSLTGVGEAKLMSELKKKIGQDLGTAYVLRDFAKTKKMKNAYNKKITILRAKLRKLS